jgi:bifunctional non-homologous end joining protein LigD
MSAPLPMLATPGTLPRGDGWAFEVKWDGVRALVRVRDSTIQITGRNGRDVTHRYPELQAVVDALDGTDALFDGEIVACDEDGLPSFERLQERMHVDDHTAIARLVREVPVVYMVFDVLAYDGETLTARPYHERRSRLEALALGGPSWRVPPIEIGDGSTIDAFTRAHDIEGIVAKRLDSVYEFGRRSPAWRKIKHSRRQEFVVGGWTPGVRGRTGDIGALVLGVYERDEHGVTRLRCCGKVGSGLRDDTRSALQRRFAETARAASPFGAGEIPPHTHFVEPSLVVEVRFAHWTSVHVVRAAVFEGIRTDKNPLDVVRES